MPPVEDERHPRVMSPTLEQQLVLQQGRMPAGGYIAGSASSSTAPLLNLRLHDDLLAALQREGRSSMIPSFPVQRCPVCFETIVGPCSQCLQCGSSVHVSCARHSGGSSMYCLNCIEDTMLRQQQGQIDAAREIGSTLGRVAYQGGALTGIALGSAASSLTRGLIQAGAGAVSGARSAWQAPGAAVQPPSVEQRGSRPRTLPAVDVGGGDSNDEMARLRAEMCAMRRRNEDLEQRLMAAHEVAAEACSERGGRSSHGGYQTPTMTPQRTSMPQPSNAAVILEPPAPPGLHQVVEQPVSPTSLDLSWNVVSNGDNTVPMQMPASQQALMQQQMQQPMQQPQQQQQQHLVPGQQPQQPLLQQAVMMQAVGAPSWPPPPEPPAHDGQVPQHPQRQPPWPRAPQGPSPGGGDGNGGGGPPYGGGGGPPYGGGGPPYGGGGGGQPFGNGWFFPGMNGGGGGGGAGPPGGGGCMSQGNDDHALDSSLSRLRDGDFPKLEYSKSSAKAAVFEDWLQRLGLKFCSIHVAVEAYWGSVIQTTASAHDHYLMLDPMRRPLVTADGSWVTAKMYKI